jgi:[protein-PII] uridylyltransferase
MMTELATPGLPREAAVARVKDVIAAGREEAERRLLAGGKGTLCAMALSDLEDEIIRALFVASGGGAMAVVATGGYGRGTLAPGSDIDLLFLLRGSQTPELQKSIEYILYTLWDARQKVGHAVRTVDECIKLARTDATILTSILESRHICGDPTLSETLAKRFRAEVVGTGVREFVANKLGERDTRHAKVGASRYLVEPDVKDGKGGLRDLHTLFWIAKYIFGTNSPDELAEKGAFAQEDLRRFRKCEDFLWAVRCHLHFISGRGEDRLSFDRQSELAERLGYKAHGGLKHVERLMKHYFLIAKEVGDLTRIFCASLEARQIKEAPRLSRVLGMFKRGGASKIKGAAGFRLESGRVAFAGPDMVKTDPVNLLRLFWVAGKQGAEVHPDALKLVWRSLNLINRDMCNDPVANRLFMEMLTDSSDPETLLRMLNEAGVLGRFIPDFGRIVAMMQFNMYHHYTVDEHLIRAVGVLASLERGDIAEDHPLSAKILPTITSRRALYAAVFLHDIAKGRPEDHSVAGESVALALSPRLGLTPAEAETVAWLIRHHLLMSETAQMRDLNDFKTILDFANIVQSPERLKLLLILTVCDIRAVGPGVWNGWKGQLLRTLYSEAEPVLTGGHTGSTRKERVAEAQALFFSRFLTRSDAEKAAYAAKHYDPYWLNVDIGRQIRHRALIASAKPKDIVTEVQSNAFTAVTELTVYAPDHPRFLSQIFGACAAANANIMGAQIFTTADGMALDTVLIQREFPSEDDELRRAERIAETIRKTLRGEIRLKDAVAKAQRPQGRLKAFSVEPRVIIDNESSNRFTVIEINGLDRIGLLHDLTESLYRLNLNIASAHITTFGEKAIDVFYVTDLTGGKIEQAQRRKQIERALGDVLTPPAEAA